MNLDICHGMEFPSNGEVVLLYSLFPSLLTVKNCDFIFVSHSNGEGKKERKRERGGE